MDPQRDPFSKGRPQTEGHESERTKTIPCVQSNPCHALAMRPTLVKISFRSDCKDRDGGEVDDVTVLMELCAGYEYSGSSRSSALVSVSSAGLVLDVIAAASDRGGH